MSYNVGDIVGIGPKGSVEYRVTNTHPEKMGDVMVESLNTGKSQLVAVSRLRLIRAAEDHVIRENGLTDAQMEEADETYAESGIHAARDYVEQSKRENDEFMLSIDGDGTEPDHEDTEENKRDQPMPAWEIELVSEFDLDRPWLLTVDHVTTGHKSYSAACDALIIAKREGFKHYAVIDHYGVRKATRIAA